MSYDEAYGEGDTFSQEFRLAFDASDTFQHMLGFFYYESTTKGGDGKPFVFLGEDFLVQGNQQPDFLDSLPFPLNFLAQPGDNLRAKSSIDTTNVAVFGQSTWYITDAWQATGGLRCTDE